MPAKDRYHDSVVRALVKAGWTIDDEQVTLLLESRTMWIDLQASHGRYQTVLMIEVKELAEVNSPIEALANAIGKIILYRVAMRIKKLHFPLVLAISVASYHGILQEDIGIGVIDELDIPLIVYDPDTENIVLWKI
jgi:hypothetical protein